MSHEHAQANALGDEAGGPMTMEREHLPRLLDALRERGYQVLGPTVAEQAIVYDELSAVEDLPIGYTDEQDGGSYRLRRRDDQAVFGFAVGPHSWKKFLHPPRVRLWRAEHDEDAFRVLPEPPEAPKYAFIGVRACELHAIAIQDQVFLRGPYVDPIYARRRDGAFIVAVNCGHAGGTCFCVSMGTGPKATAGFDLALTEVLTAERHYFVVEVGTALGAEILQEIPHTAAREAEQQAAEQVIAQTAAHMGRVMETAGIHDLLMGNLDHPRWEQVATRCLTCANCTMVCPTCFCTTVDDTSDLAGTQAERWRRWDSCFTADFSYVHGGSVRASAKSRYRQWMTHKLATWIDQFGTSGCVGCGRCITWCPVGIDITEEVHAIRESPRPAAPAAAAP
jgi:sulfhydrogenase subunit beta (sulfur reductase)